MRDGRLGAALAPVRGLRSRARAVRDDRLTALVLAATAAALLARLLFLGGRFAHWDEGRVAYWTLRYAETGTFSYRPILHGPFLQQVNRLVFAVLGASDATMRLVVALLGGLLPLAALLLRRRLRDREVVALALLLAFDPTLLYYSRFMRADVPTAAFGFLAFAFLVRAVDRRRRRAVVVAAGLFALALTAKENALTYPVSWLGAAVLLLDHRLLAARAAGESAVRRLRSIIDGARPAIRTLAAGAVPGLAVALVVLVAFYAPRDPNPGAVSLGNALADPGLWPAVVEAATVDVAGKLYGLWVSPDSPITAEYSYPVTLGATLKDLALASAGTVALAVVGFLAERYGPGEPRDLPLFGFYWGVTALLGYPAITDIPAPWLATHVLVGFAVPAAVGAAVCYRYGRAALEGATDARTVAAAAVLVLAAVQIGAVGAHASYVDPDGPHELAQYVQPRGDFGPTRAAIDSVGDAGAGSTGAAADDGPDVLLYGEGFVRESPNPARRPACARWYRVLPFPWYFERADADVACAANASALPDRLPPVVVADGNASLAPLEERTDGWTRTDGTMRQGDRRVVTFVDTDRV